MEAFLTRVRVARTEKVPRALFLHFSIIWPYSILAPLLTLFFGSVMEVSLMSLAFNRQILQSAIESQLI